MKRIRCKQVNVNINVESREYSICNYPEGSHVAAVIPLYVSLVRGVTVPHFGAR